MSLDFSVLGAEDKWAHAFKTLNSKRYVRLILLPFFDVLTQSEELYGHFMQDDAIAHNVETINKKVYTMY